MQQVVSPVFPITVSVPSSVAIVSRLPVMPIGSTATTSVSA